jgi:hypothetical protein
MSSLQQNWRKGQNRFCLDVGGCREQGAEMAQIMYAHMNKRIKKTIGLVKWLKVKALGSSHSTTKKK